MKYRIIVDSIKGSSNPWIVEAASLEEAARKACPSDNRYWKYKVVSIGRTGCFQIWRRLQSDPLHVLANKKTKRMEVGGSETFGDSFSVEQAEDE